MTSEHSDESDNFEILPFEEESDLLDSEETSPEENPEESLS